MEIHIELERGKNGLIQVIKKYTYSNVISSGVVPVTGDTIVIEMLTPSTDINTYKVVDRVIRYFDNSDPKQIVRLIVKQINS